MLAKAVWCRMARSGTVGAVTIALLVSGGVGAHADELDDRKVQVEQNIDHLSEDLEVLDDDIKVTDSKLRGLQAQLPAAEQALDDAQGRVGRAADEAADLARRVQSAGETRDQLNVKIAEGKVKLEDSKQVIGQIATEAYKRGGVSSDLTLLLNASSDGNLAAGMDLADQAMRSQNAALDALSEQSATDENVKLRLAAVEAEIADLKSAADAALAREQVARDDAEVKKQSLDGIISQTDALSAELLAQRPRIQRKLRTEEAEQVKVTSEIKERQERLIREEAERKRKAEAVAEAERQRVAQETAKKAAEQKAKWEREEASRAKKAKEEAARQKKKDTYVKPQYVAPKPKPQAAPQAAPQERSSWGLIRPVSGGRQTSSFGWRPTPAGTIDYGGRGGYVHAGVDWGFGGQCGAPVRAAADGEVWTAGWGGSSGNKVTVSHGVVKGKALATNYHHMQSVVVSVGQRVKQGQLVGYVGTTGNSTGCHMHFETIINGAAVNPLGLL